MPLYGYVCNDCGHDFQTLVLGAERPECPSCDGRDLEQQLSLIAAPTKGRDALQCEASPSSHVCAGCCQGCG